jgi:hypothetical protein
MINRKRAAVPHGQANFRYGLMRGAERQQFIDAATGPGGEFFANCLLTRPLDRGR